MLTSTSEIIKYCQEEGIRFPEMVLRDEVEKFETDPKEILEELGRMLDVMEESTQNYLDHPSDLGLGMINGFAYKMMGYRDQDSLVGSDLVQAMAMALSTFETNSSMGRIVAAPTAGSAGILPAALMYIKAKEGTSREDLVEGLLVSVGLGQIIGYYASFAGAEGGCQAECGSAAAMAAGCLVYLKKGNLDQVFQAASIALVNVLGLVCDPIAGLVEYPCTFRNASGLMNALISADMALAGAKSVVPFEEVAQAMKEVGDAMVESLRETGTGGLAATKTGSQIRKDFFKKNGVHID